MNLREHIEHDRSRARMTGLQILEERLDNEQIAAMIKYFQLAGLHEEADLYLGEEILIESMFYNGHDIDEVKEALRWSS